MQEEVEKAKKLLLEQKTEVSVTFIFITDNVFSMENYILTTVKKIFFSFYYPNTGRHRYSFQITS